MYILAFDPGKTTGVCCIDANSRTDYSIVLADIISWEMRCFRVYEIITTFAKADPDLKIVIEDFLLYPARSAGLAFDKVPSARIIGIITLACHLNGIDADDKEQVIYQMASQIHNTNKELHRGSGKYTVNIKDEERKQFANNNHDLDAFVHAKHYLLFHSDELFPVKKAA